VNPSLADVAQVAALLAERHLLVRGMQISTLAVKPQRVC
jgi:hypothetical protein